MAEGPAKVNGWYRNTAFPWKSKGPGRVGLSSQCCLLDRFPEQRVVVGIPAFNEESNIGNLVQRITALGFVQKVVVADDGSSDRTSAVAERAGAMVVRHDTNLGAGAATRTCFEAARRGGATILVTLDGDGQHDPNEIPNLVAPIAENRADVVIGSRFLQDRHEVPFFRKVGIDMITLLCNFGAGVGVSDSQSCFRAYGERALSCLAIEDQGFGFSVETLVEARRRRLRMAEVPISCIYNSASHTISPLIHGPTVALAVLKHRLTLFLRDLTEDADNRHGMLPPASTQGTGPFTS